MDEPEVKRETGLEVPMWMGPLPGGGYRGATDGLDEAAVRASALLQRAFGRPFTLRFNSDRHSGGAFLCHQEENWIQSNSEVGLHLSLRPIFDAPADAPERRLTGWSDQIDYEISVRGRVLRPEFKPEPDPFYPDGQLRQGVSGIEEGVRLLTERVDPSRLAPEFMAPASPAPPAAPRVRVRRPAPPGRDLFS
jgi:hypothetical protein